MLSAEAAIFGTWYNFNFLVSGKLLWLGPLQFCSEMVIYKVIGLVGAREDI